MSDLLNSASLVMIPSGYKEDTVYSVVPSDGSGDLSFTRASNGTRINSAGLVEVTPWNLVQQSETFNLSPWGYSEVAITLNATTAPNGTTTAEKLKTTTANAGHQLFQSFTSENANHTFSIYAKKGELNYIQLALGNSIEQYANFNLNTGVVGTKGSYCASSSIESVGNGWYRCTAYFNQGTMPTLMVWLTNSASSDWGGIAGWAGANNTDGIFIWGAQLNIGSTAKPYFPTTDRLNVPRLTYQNGGGGCPSLLLEKQSTNLVSYSEDFTNAVYTKVEVTASTNATTSPDGTVNGNSIFETTVSSTHESWQRASMTSGQLYTQSCFLKANGRNRVIMQIFDNSTQYASAIYDLSTGVVVASNGTATIQSMGNGWYRCTITGTSPATGSGYCVLGLCENTYTNSSVMPTYVGDTAKGIYWWGAQVEASSYPTSYIPTTSSSATRVADACYKTGISSLIGQTEGVLFVDINYISHEGQSILAIEDWVINSTVIRILTDTSTTLSAQVYEGGNQYSATFNSAVNGQRYKCALAYKANNFAFYVNGTQVSTSSSGTVPTSANVRFGAFISGQVMDGQINQAALFKTRLTNAELASLTTI